MTACSLRSKVLEVVPRDPPPATAAVRHADELAAPQQPPDLLLADAESLGRLMNARTHLLGRAAHYGYPLSEGPGEGIIATTQPSCVSALTMPRAGVLEMGGEPACGAQPLDGLVQRRDEGTVDVTSLGHGGGFRGWHECCA